MYLVRVCRGMGRIAATVQAYALRGMAAALAARASQARDVARGRGCSGRRGCRDLCLPHGPCLCAHDLLSCLQDVQLHCACVCCSSHRRCDMEGGGSFFAHGHVHGIDGEQHTEIEGCVGQEGARAAGRMFSFGVIFPFAKC